MFLVFSAIVCRFNIFESWFQDIAFVGDVIIIFKVIFYVNIFGGIGLNNPVFIEN